MRTPRSQVRWVPTPRMLILASFDPDGLAGPLTAIGTGVLGGMVLYMSKLLQPALATETFLWWFMIAFGAAVCATSALALVFRLVIQPWLWRSLPLESAVGRAWCQWRAAASGISREGAARRALLAACQQSSPPTIAVCSLRYREDLAADMGLPLLEPEIVRGLHQFRRWVILAVCALLVLGGIAIQWLVAGGAAGVTSAGVGMVMMLAVVLMGRRARSVGLLAASGAVERMDNHRRWTVEDSVLLLTRGRRDAVRVTLVGPAGVQVVEFPDTADPALRSLWQRWTSRVFRPELRAMDGA